MCERCRIREILDEYTFDGWKTYATVLVVSADVVLVVGMLLSAEVSVVVVTVVAVFVAAAAVGFGKSITAYLDFWDPSVLFKAGPF